jgi:hypothetical protein
MNEENQHPTQTRPQPNPLSIIAIGVCIAAIIYYLLKFSGTRLLSHDGEFILDTVLMVALFVNAVIISNKKKQCKKDSKEGA